MRSIQILIILFYIGSSFVKSQSINFSGSLGYNYGLYSKSEAIYSPETILFLNPGYCFSAGLEAKYENKSRWITGIELGYSYREISTNLIDFTGLHRSKYIGLQNSIHLNWENSYKLKFIHPLKLYFIGNLGMHFLEGSSNKNSIYNSEIFIFRTRTFIDPSYSYVDAIPEDYVDEFNDAFSKFKSYAYFESGVSAHWRRFGIYLIAQKNITPIYKNNDVKGFYSFRGGITYDFTYLNIKKISANNADTRVTYDQRKLIFGARIGSTLFGQLSAEGELPVGTEESSQGPNGEGGLYIGKGNMKMVTAVPHFIIYLRQKINHKFRLEYNIGIKDYHTKINGSIVFPETEKETIHHIGPFAYTNFEVNGIIDIQRKNLYAHQVTFGLNYYHRDLILIYGSTIENGIGTATQKFFCLTTGYLFQFNRMNLRLNYQISLNNLNKNNPFSQLYDAKNIHLIEIGIGYDIF